jgi:hypothetical protein
LVLLLENLQNFIFCVAGSNFFSQLVTQEQTHPFSTFSRTHYRKKERKLSERERERKRKSIFFCFFFFWDVAGGLGFM